MQAETEIRKTIGRCPDCGSRVEVQRIAGRTGSILPHGCPARECEYHGCRVIGLQNEMTRLDDQAWYCPSHALVVVAEDLVSLYRTRGDADWTLISEILGETLPELLLKAKTRLTGVGARPP
jgi:hypothetical protein